MTRYSCPQGSVGILLNKSDFIQSFHNVGKLPFAKKEIYHSIIESLKISFDDKIRQALIAALLQLFHFQENTGDSSVRASVDLTHINIAELLPEQYLEMNACMDESMTV